MYSNPDFSAWSPEVQEDYLRYSYKTFCNFYPPDYWFLSATTPKTYCPPQPCPPNFFCKFVNDPKFKFIQELYFWGRDHNYLKISFLEFLKWEPNRKCYCVFCRDPEGYRKPKHFIQSGIPKKQLSEKEINKKTWKEFKFKKDRKSYARKHSKFWKTESNSLIRRWGKQVIRNGAWDSYSGKNKAMQKLIRN